MFWVEFLKKLPAKWVPAVILLIWGLFWGVGVKLGFQIRLMLAIAIIATVVIVLVWLVLMAITAKKVKQELEIRRLAEISSSGVERQRRLEEKLLYAIRSMQESKIGKDIGKKSAQYALPWYMIIGPTSSGKTSLLMRSGLDLRLRDPSATELLPGPTKDCDWLFANEAVIMDTTGRYVTYVDKSLDKAEWLGLLDQLKRYRRAKPIDGLIVAVDISMMLKANDEEIERSAHMIRERIDDIIKELGISFPVYLIFTKCDLVQGFTQFFGNLSREEREQILGCSFTSQQQVNCISAFREEWKVLCDSLKARVRTTLTPDTDPKDRRGIFIFPRQLELAYEKVNRFVSALFRPSTYLETPALNGFYLTSSLQEVTPIDLLMENIERTYNIRVAPSVKSPEETKSYFIKDAFVRAIFTAKNLVSLTAKAQRQIYIRWLVPLLAEIIILSALITGIWFSFNHNESLLNRSPDVARQASEITSSMPLPEIVSRIDSLQNYIKELRAFHILWRGQRHKVASALESKYFVGLPIKVLKDPGAGEKPKPIPGAFVYEELLKDKGVKTDRNGEAKLKAFKWKDVAQIRIKVDYQEAGWGIEKVIKETQQGRSEMELIEPMLVLSSQERFRSVQVVFAKLRVLMVQVFDDKKGPLSGVPVSIMDQAKTIPLASGFSDDTGTARLEFQARDGSILNVNFGESGISFPSSKQLRVDPSKYDYSLEEVLRTKPPTFEIQLESPSPNLTTKEETIKVKGKVIAAAKNASMDGISVQVGDQIAFVRAGGFSMDKFPLNEGKNDIAITVVNAQTGQPLSQTVLRTVTRISAGAPSASPPPTATAPATTAPQVTTPPATTPQVTTPPSVTPSVTAPPSKPQVARIEISPPTIQMKPGEQRNFTAVAYDADGKPISDAEITWGLEGNIGTVDQSGTFIAQKSGSGRITVVSGRAKGSAQVTVISPAWRVISTLNKDFRDVFFVDSKTGWAVGYPMLIARSDNAGLSWQYQLDGSTGKVTLSDGTSFGAEKLKSAIKSVHFIRSGDKLLGWAVGERGIILHSPDGNKWVSQPSFVNETLEGLYFVDAMKGWAVGRNGTILYTTDGGAKWNRQPYRGMTAFYGVYFLDPNRGWIVGQNGTILSTTNGGAQWTVQTDPTQKSYLRDVFFISPSRGWIVGTEGLILQTNNGGQSWTIQVSRTINNLFGVRFVSENDGWAVGEGGIILYTSDGGKTWSQTRVGDQNLLSISSTGPGEAWAVGSKGAIASYTFPQ